MRRLSIKSLAVLILLSFCAHLCEMSLLNMDILLGQQHAESATQDEDHSEVSALKTVCAKASEPDLALALLLADAESAPGLELTFDHHGLGCQLSHNFSTPGAIKWIDPNRIALESPAFPTEAEFSLPSNLPGPSLHFSDIFHPPA